MTAIHTMLLIAIPLSGLLLILSIAIDAFPLQLPPVPKERNHVGQEDPRTH